MKKWFFKNKDQILTTFIVGIFVFIVSKLFNFLFGLFSNYHNGFLNFLNKIVGFSISIPVYSIVLFIILIILIPRIYNLIKIKNRKLKIIKATYFTDSRSINITNELNNAIEDNKLKIVLSNNIAGDPHYGVVKKGKIKYKIKGHEKEKEYKEGDIIELP